jgi:hypothetical protein
MSEDNCARLEKIQGGVDLINEKLSSSNQLANERHENMRNEIAQLKAVDAGLDGRVGVLESESSERVGQLKGLALSGRILWTVIGAVPVGLVALALKLFGV